jgi:Fur family transcriptional regulator, ferric uptake regulator
MTQKRSTWQKSAVRTALEEAHGFASANELYLAILGTGLKVGLTTVYRAITELAEANEVDVLTGEDGEAKYRLCSTSHHHHLICRVCGKTVEFDLAGFEAAAATLAREHGFGELTHSIELFGICKNCGVAS